MFSKYYLAMVNKLKYAVWIIGMILTQLGFSQGDHPSSQRISTFGANQVINCTSDSALIGVQIDNWIEGFQYVWSDGTTDSTTLVKPSQTQVYSVTISHSGLNLLLEKSISVAVEHSPIVAHEAEISVDKFTCPGEEITIESTFNGGHAPFSFVWDNGDNNSTTTVSPSSNETFFVTITDQCGSEAESQVRVVFEPRDPLSFSDISIDFTCPDEEVTLRPDLGKVKGGVGYGYRFAFGDWKNENMPITTTPPKDKIIPFEVTDACGIDVLKKEIRFVKNEIELPKCDDELVCKGSEVSVTSQTDGLYFWNEGVMHTNFTTTVEKPTTYELSFLDQCGDMHGIEKKVSIKEINSNFDYQVYQFDESVVLNSPVINQTDKITWLLNGAEISNERNPELDLPAGVEHEVELIVEDEEGCTSRTQRIIVLRDGIDIPTAFSPNGDGLNDYFSVRFEEEMKYFDIKIFDRWGQLIYHSNDQYFRWMGVGENQSQTLASFAFILKATTVSEKQIEKRGVISAFSFE